jgi:hypothetical protein
MAMDELLKRIQAILNGRLVTDDEIVILRHSLPSNLIPDWLTGILKEHRITGSVFVLSEDDDESRLGVEMQWLTPEQIIDEGLNAYPGIVALRRGYLPVGSCLIGSGDPYFLNMSVPEDPPVVRIPHEAASSSGDSIDANSFEMVAQTLTKFFEKATSE